MPELPEVETVVRGLREMIVGKTIMAVRLIRRDIWRAKPPMPRQMVGAQISGVDRKGKNIIISLSNRQALIVHLKMTGRLTFELTDYPVRKHTHLIVKFTDGEMRFNDIRRFGYLDLTKQERLAELDYLKALGPDPLQIDREEFVRLLRSKKRIIKSLLLDQTVLAGLGNIYSDEALFLAGIHPRRVSAGLSAKRLAGLYDAVRQTLEDAILARGSSVDDYVDARGAKGSFQDRHTVYGREGRPCPKCGHPIKRTVIGSRSSHFCPHCQK